MAFVFMVFRIWHFFGRGENLLNFSYPIVRVMTISFVSGIYLAQFFGEPG